MPFTTQSCCASTEHRVRALTGPERFGQSQHVPATRSLWHAYAHTYSFAAKRKSCSTAVRGCMHDARVVRGEATTWPGSRKSVLTRRRLGCCESTVRAPDLYIPRVHGRHGIVVVTGILVFSRTTGAHDNTCKKELCGLVGEDTPDLEGSCAFRSVNT